MRKKYAYKKELHCNNYLCQHILQVPDLKEESLQFDPLCPKCESIMTNKKPNWEKWSKNPNGVFIKLCMYSRYIDCISCTIKYYKNIKEAEKGINDGTLFKLIPLNSNSIYYIDGEKVLKSIEILIGTTCNQCVKDNNDYCYCSALK